MTAPQNSLLVDAEEARRRLRSIFEFQVALARLTHPPVLDYHRHDWQLSFGELPKSRWISVRVREGREGDESPLFRVDRPVIPECPELDGHLRNWLEPGWGDYRQVPKYLTVREDAEGRRESFDADPRRAEAWADWSVERARWAEEAREATAAHEIYSKLWSLHATMMRDGGAVELLWGDGMVYAKHEGVQVLHPAVVQRVELTFDPSTPSFTVDLTEAPPEILPVIVYTVAGESRKPVEDLINDFRTNPVDPEEPVGWGQFLKRLASSLNKDGRYVDSAPTTTPFVPMVWSDPMLLLRKRQDGLAGAAERALDRLRQGAELPGGLSRLVGYDPSRDAASEHPVDRWEEVVGQPSDVLFAKAANAEQGQIARRLEKYGSVLVQGPPGTGKSHTIANLIGALLAQGKRILVTSHTTKALRVLRGHVPERLRPLCVTVLDSDRQSNEEMLAAVTELTSGMSKYDRDALARSAKKAEDERRRLLSDLDKVCDELFKALEGESSPLNDGGKSISPAVAAKWVSSATAAHGWIPGPSIQIGVLPLSHEEVHELYRFHAEVPQDLERAAAGGLPDQDAVLSPAQFEELLMTIELGTRATEGAAVESTASIEDHDGLRDLAEILRNLIGAGRGLQEWSVYACRDALLGAEATKPWRHVEGEARKLAEKATKARVALLDVELSWVEPSAAPILADWLAQRAGSAGVHRPLGWVERFGSMGRLIRRAVRVDGSAPHSSAHLSAVHREAELRGEATKLLSRLRKLTEGKLQPGTRDPIGIAGRGIEFANAIDSALIWAAAATDGLAQRLGPTPIRLRPGDHSQVDPTAACASVHRLQSDLEATLADVEAALTKVRGMMASAVIEEHVSALGHHHDVVSRELSGGLTERDRTKYSLAFQRYRTAWAVRERLPRRAALLESLSALAPHWAEKIAARHGVHAKGTPPGDLDAAWRWRMLTDQIEERLRLDERELLTELGRLRGRLEAATAEVIYNFAWLGLHQRTTLPQTLALQGWAQLTKSLGKGTGKLAPKKRAAARDLLVQCQGAVPVWIMPLNRVYESFGAGTDGFDVVIVDEASQADVFSLLALAMGKELVVVGDDQQVSPLDVGINTTEVNKLVEQHLTNVPNPMLYGTGCSLYALASTCFGGSIRLLEHFRCVPEIISYSNELAYQGTIRPLREGTTERLPAVVSHFVSTGRRGDGKINPVEALRIVSLVAALCERKEYEKAHLGVVSLLGNEQAGHIERLLHRYVGAEEIEGRRIVCGTAAQFQGDERDVIFLSMVDSPGDGPLRLVNDVKMKQRYNVAASRARDQLWLVHSLDPALHLKPGDLRRGLLEFAADPEALVRKLRTVANRAESEFEREVFQHLTRESYRVEQQVWVGSYRLDGVVHGAEGRVAVECDGERFHGPDQVRDDMVRQSILERLGWRFIRIRGSRYYGDKAKALEWLTAELAARGVHPLGTQAEDSTTAPGRNTALREAIVRRAEELERQWATDDAASSGASVA